jgi:hypothetical protein
MHPKAQGVPRSENPSLATEEPANLVGPTLFMSLHGWMPLDNNTSTSEHLLGTVSKALRSLNRSRIAPKVLRVDCFTLRWNLVAIPATSEGGLESPERRTLAWQASICAYLAEFCLLLDDIPTTNKVFHRSQVLRRSI